MTARFHSPEDVIEVLRNRSADSGQNATARSLGVSQGYVSNLLAGKKPAAGIGDAVLLGLGFDPTPHYRRLKRNRHD